MAIDVGNAGASVAAEEFVYEVRVAGRFRMGKKIGSGSFGEIYLGRDLNTGGEVAVKFEQLTTRRAQVIEEAKLLKELNGEFGFPKYIWYGREGDFHIMVIELLGPSLEDLFAYCGRKLSLKTVLLIAQQLVSRIEVLHKRGYIHRDMKPENILIGLEEHASTVFLIDYGLAKKWKLPNGDHIPFRTGKSLTGTARYASANTHLGEEQSRRDDLEGAGYVLLYLLKGELPWQGLLGAKNKAEKYQKIKECKVNTSIELLCQGYPEEMATYMNYCKNLKFDEEPNYAFLIRLFKELYNKCCFEHEYMFDWTI
jgi:casein kinase 1